MFAASRAYLIDHLMAAGIKKPPFTSLKKLKNCAESHQAAVLFDREELARSSRKAVYDASGQPMQRTTVFDRTIVWSVIIGEYTPEKAEQIYTQFLAELGTGFWADGDYISIDATDAEWVDEDDSILRAKIAVKLTITCKGPLRRDAARLQLQQINITPDKEL